MGVAKLGSGIKRISAMVFDETGTNFFRTVSKDQKIIVQEIQSGQ